MGVQILVVACSQVTYADMNVKAATLADSEGKSAMKALQRAQRATILDCAAITRDPCGGATMINAACKKKTSR